MDITVVLACTSTLDNAIGALVALSELEEPARHLVVVDDAVPAVEGLLALLEGDVTPLTHRRPAGLGAAFTTGLLRADSDLVLLLRDDVVAHPALLRRLHDALQPGAVAAVAVRDDLEDSLAALPLAASALLVRRDVLLEVGGTGGPDELVLPSLVHRLAQRGQVAATDRGLLAPAPAPAAGTRGSAACGADVELTVVVPTLDATSDRTRRCLSALQACTDVAQEIVVVDNGAAAQGFSAPVNAGIRAARGRYVVVCNDDAEVLPGWWPPLRAALDAGASVAYPFTVDGPNRPDFAAWLFAMPRRTVERHAAEPGEFFRPDLKVWYQDTDLLVRLRAAGTPPVQVTDSQIRHGLSQTLTSPEARLKEWVRSQVLADRAVFESLHGTEVPGAAVFG